MPPLRIAVVLFILAVAGACGSDSTGPDSPGVRVVSNITRTDTIDARPSGRMVVQLPGFGDGVSRQVSVSGAPSGDPDRPGMLPFDVGGSGSATTTSTTGEVSFRVVFGRKPGPAAVIITVPELHATYSLWFEIKPGAPALMTLLPGDTSIVRGATYKQTARVFDRVGNDLNLGSQVTTFTTDPKITRSASNDITGTDYTRAAIRVQYGTLAYTAMVSVVPEATFAGANFGYVQITRSDGTEVRRAPLASFSNGTAWAPDGSKVAYTNLVSFPNGGGHRILALAKATGEVTRVIPDTVTGLSNIELAWPSYSRDAQWIFFVAIKGFGGAIWRARADGSNAEEIVPALTGPPARVRASPSLSRDGILLAYRSGTDVEILDMATGSTRIISGLLPISVRWSPVNDLLAVRGHTSLYTINADGSDVRTLTSDLAGETDPTLDWSPDGRWLVVAIPNPAAPTKATVLEVQTGLTLPLRFSAGATVSWAPQ